MHGDLETSWLYVLGVKVGGGYLFRGGIAEGPKACVEMRCPKILEVRAPGRGVGSNSRS